MLKKRISEIRAGKPHGAQIEKTTLADLHRMLIDDYKANARRSTYRAGTASAHWLEYFSKTKGATERTYALRISRATK